MRPGPGATLVAMKPSRRTTRRLALLGGAVAVAALARREARRPAYVPDLGPLPERSRSATTEDGVRLHVVEDGDPSSDVTVVMVHGFQARQEEFFLQQEALRPHARLVLVDLRGHGRSDFGDPSGATIEQLGRDIASVLEQVVPTGPVVLLGHSMGGMAVLSLVRQRPELLGDRVQGVFLLATSAGDVVTEGPVAAGVKVLTRMHLLQPYLQALQLVSPLLEHQRRRGTRGGTSFTRRYLFGRDDADPETVLVVQALLEETPWTVCAAFYPTFLTHDETEALPLLRGVEVSILVGDSDRLTPASHSRRMAELVGPSAELTVVPGAGHSVNVTRPEVVDAAVLRLLDRVRSRWASGVA